MLASKGSVKTSPFFSVKMRLRLLSLRPMMKYAVMALVPSGVFPMMMPRPG